MIIIENAQMRKAQAGEIFEAGFYPLLYPFSPATLKSFHIQGAEQSKARIKALVKEMWPMAQTGQVNSISLTPQPDDGDAPDDKQDMDAGKEKVTPNSFEIPDIPDDQVIELKGNRYACINGHIINLTTRSLMVEGVVRTKWVRKQMKAHGLI